MDESLAVALRVFFATIAPSVVDPAVRRAIDKVDDVMSRVADGDIEPTKAASYIRDVVVVLS
jgi:hypothetical protein